MDLPNKGDVPPKKKVEQLVTGVQEVDRPATRRFMGAVFAENPRDLGKKIGRDVIVPRLKAGFEEAVGSFLHGMLWGGGSSPLSGIARGTVLRGGGTNYSGISSGTPSALQQAQAATTVSTGPYKDLVCPTMEKAEILLAGMYGLLNDYRVVAVADLYEMAGITPGTQDNAFGWMSLDGSRISKVRDGYLLELPRPSRI